MIFIDTNYYVRFLIQDIPIQFKEVEKLFSEGANQKKKLFTSIIVIFEIYWVFGSFYEKTKKELIDILNKIFALNFIEIEEKESLMSALNIYKTTNLEFEDCYNIIYSRKNDAKEFKTYDKKLKNYIKKA